MMRPAIGEMMSWTDSWRKQGPTPRARPDLGHAGLEGNGQRLESGEVVMASVLSVLAGSNTAWATRAAPSTHGPHSHDKQSHALLRVTSRRLETAREESSGLRPHHHARRIAKEGHRDRRPKPVKRGKMVMCRSRQPAEEAPEFEVPEEGPPRPQPHRHWTRDGIHRARDVNVPGWSAGGPRGVSRVPPSG